MKRVLLTGGSGFVGRNIIESPLTEKFEFLAPRHAELDCIDEDSVNRYFRENRFDYVIHSATKPGHRNAKDSSNLFYANTRMFFNLARRSDDYERLIVIGSGAIYDMRYYHPLMREDEWNLHLASDEHGFSKYVCETSIEGSRNIFDARIFGIFGKYEDYAIRFISNMICKALFDLPLTMKQDRVFSYLYVDDLMPILGSLLLSPVAHHSYNVVPDERVHLIDLARLVLRIAGKDLPIIVAEEGLGSEYSGSNERLRAEFPSVAFTPISAAIASLTEWYREHRGLLEAEFLLNDR